MTDLLKVFVGRPRPYFAAICVAYVEGSKSHCTGDAAAVTEARKSFPSGHSSLAFSAAIYLACYISSSVGIGAFGNATTRAELKAWKSLATLCFPILACFVAASRTVDYHHNYSDVVAGSLIGAAIAFVVVHNRLADLSNIRNDSLEEAENLRVSSQYEILERSAV